MFETFVDGLKSPERRSLEEYVLSGSIEDQERHLSKLQETNAYFLVKE